MQKERSLTRPDAINREILVLPSWYPSRLDDFSGDFIKRHVQAISLLHKQFVLYVVKDPTGEVTNNVLETVQHSPNLTEVILYYHVKRTGIPFFDKARSHYKASRLYKKLLVNYIRQKGLPPLVHVHVALKAGLVALWLKRKFGVNYVLSEHWTGYLPEAIPRLQDQTKIFKKWIRQIVSNATVITAVSKHLADALNAEFPFVHPLIIPNVVDTSIFFPVKRERHLPKRFVHISTMTYAKNFEKIVEALCMVKSKNFDFRLDVFGPLQPAVVENVNNMLLSDSVFFHGNVNQETLATEMQQCDALIHFSNVETFGCVVIEAISTGLPAFISDIPALQELITDNKNGFVVKADDSEELANKLMLFIEGKLILDDVQDTDYMDRFSYKSVAGMFSKIYATRFENRPQ